jgi:hypothetical protein
VATDTPDGRARPADADQFAQIEAAPLYSEHWLIHAADRGQERWWVWCPVRMTGGIDTDRIRWGRPMGELVAKADEPDTGAGPGRPAQNRAWHYSEEPIAEFDLPWLEP